LREDESISKEIAKEVVVFPFNNTEVTIDIIRRNRNRLAAVIIEPVMHAAGVIPAQRAYSKASEKSRQI
jgi:glutamate-1-semialdehyde aminotransferase